MEVVCVIAHCHKQSILYRDLKPENLLIDADGHVRLCDMGLAARITAEAPRRTSRVGTECYMAPEVRWADKRSEAYGVSCDWYTVGVLAYEFSRGDLPYLEPEQPEPVYTPHDFKDDAMHDFVTRLLDQDHRTRLGSGSDGVQEIFEHPYWRGVEWDLVPLKKFDSPLKGVKQVEKGKKRRANEELAVQVAQKMVDGSEDDGSQPVKDWDFVAPSAIVEEYMENMYRLVSQM